MKVNARGNSILVLVVLALLPIGFAACSKVVTVTRPEDPPAPGYAGDWTGPFQGSELLLSIRPFSNERTTTGNLRWESIDWPVECTSFDVPDQEEPGLTCTIFPQADVEFCGDPDPFFDITEAVPRTRLEVEIGGQIREGSGSPCDGTILQSLEPGGTITLAPNLAG